MVKKKYVINCFSRMLPISVCLGFIIELKSLNYDELRRLNSIFISSNSITKGPKHVILLWIFMELKWLHMSAESLFQ